MRPFEALFFDLGSTLIFFDGDWPEVYAQANAELLRYLKQAGLNLDEQSFLQEFNLRLQDYHDERESEFIEYTTAYILRSLLVEWGYTEIPETLVRSALRAMYRISQAHWHAEADAISTLEILRARDYRLGIISNAADDADVQTLVDGAGLRAYFEVVLSSAAACVRKPNPKIFEMAMMTMDILPGQAAMIGDSLGADILGAKNAGLYAIWITRRADTHANLAHAGTILPDKPINVLSELPDLLDSLSK